MSQSNYTHINVPEYNPRGNETINQYIRRVERYKSIILKEKYDIILNFINDWINNDKNIVYESLVKFTNIRESILLKNDKHNRNILKKYSEQINNIFKLDPNEDIDDTQDKYMIIFLTKLLNYIDYVLIKKEFKGKFIYSIRKG